MTNSTHTLTLTLTTTICSALIGLTGACDSDRDSRGQSVVLFQGDADPGGTDSSRDTDPGGTDSSDTEGALMERTPWLVSIQRMGDEGPHWCSGAIISKEWVLTAAHCVEGKSAPTLQVVAGIDRLGDTKSAKIRGVEQIVMHPDYAPRRLGHDDDLALLRLDESLEGSGEGVSAIALGTLADLEPTTSGVSGVLSGWGEVSSGEDRNDMQVIAVDLLSNPEARAAFNTPITADQLASKPIEDMFACQADSGGPLVLDTLEEPRLVGVASEGTGCADPLSPQLYARVSSYLAWIESEVGAP